MTRLRDHLTLVIDNTRKLGAAVSRNRGEKASALEVTERLRIAAAKGNSIEEAKPGQPKVEKELARTKSKTLDIGI